ncbi:MAG: hypothetical protein ABR524_14140, partial [Thermoanaerobaculia bacterium]
LEQTARVAQEMADTIRQDPAVTDYQLYVGTASPYNFNGLVRHYFMRSGPTVADIQVNLLPKDKRSLQSHDIATRIRRPDRRCCRHSWRRSTVPPMPRGQN